MYKGQGGEYGDVREGDSICVREKGRECEREREREYVCVCVCLWKREYVCARVTEREGVCTVSYTHLRAHETGRSRMPSSA